LRAPMDGIVNKVYVQTIGGVVRGGEPLVEIVPSDKKIIVEAKLLPKDRGKIWPGLPATVKISAYEYSIYGGLPGKVIDISADAFQEANGQSFYRIRLQADTAPFGASKPVVPGMTAEVDIKSGRHTVLQYLFEPISNIRAKALQE
jgi:membrane fusion protein, adhesin transport system